MNEGWQRVLVTSDIRASSTDTAGTAMAAPVFEKNKWHPLDSNLITHV